MKYSSFLPQQRMLSATTWSDSHMQKRCHRLIFEILSALKQIALQTAHARIEEVHLDKRVRAVESQFLQVWDSPEAWKASRGEHKTALE